MIDVNKLKGAIVSAGKIQNEVAKALGITPKTFFLKLKKESLGWWDWSYDWLPFNWSYFVYFSFKECNLISYKKWSDTNETRNRKSKIPQM